MIFALAGNQNCGKTTLFNALTGSNQHVGNFPGVTVDQKIGEIKDGKSGSVVDLPGIYSLRPYTQEEIVTRDFLERAFTVIFLATIIIWFLQTFDTKLNVVTDSADSLLALVGQFISGIFRPLGFNDWRVATALISGFTAKEAVVSTLAVLLNTSTANLGAALGTLFTPLSALSFLVFTLLYTPCIAAVTTIRRELGSFWKMLGVVVLQCSVAWLMGMLVHQIGGLL